jgi:hypothetical protein
VKDENGKLVRNGNNVAGGGGRGGGGMGGGRGGGGRGGGRGGGSGGGRGGGQSNPRLINSWITKAESVKDILSVFRDNIRDLNHIHVSAAFNMLGKMAKSRDHSPRHLTTDGAFQELLRLARDFAENRKFDPQHVANTTHGIAKLHEAGRLGGSVDDTLAALEIDAVRVAPKMKPQELANTAYAYSVLGRMPGEETWTALEAAVRRLAPRDMNSQDVANLVWSYATLFRMPVEETWAALEAAAVRVAPDMHAQAVSITLYAYAKLGQTPGDEAWAALEAAAGRVAPEMVAQAVANTVWGYATLGKAPGDETWAALEAAAGRVARGVKPQELANLVWAYAKLDRMPGKETWAALEAAAGRVARDMNEQDVANTVLAYATLGRMPGAETRAALETAAGRVAAEMKPQELANTVWAYTALSTLRGVEPPSCDAAVWDRVCGLEARDFSDESLYMLFHAHLMHTSSDTSRSVKVVHPAWLTVEARDAWKQQVQDDNTTSRSQGELARALGELGVKHQEERVTDDGYFSMDIYLPEYDVAVEFDGPSHYYHNITDSSSTSRDASMTKTAKTELRDLLLAKQCAKVVTVPYFEFDRVLNSPEKRRLYVKEKLAKEAGVTI